jgi:hypothetical protein
MIFHYINIDYNHFNSFLDFFNISKYLYIWIYLLAYPIQYNVNLILISFIDMEKILGSLMVNLINILILSIS